MNFASPRSFLPSSPGPMHPGVRTIERSARRVLRQADAALNRLYGWRLNPLYQSGTIVILLFLILLATGLWLLLFYRIGEPWGSVARLTANPWIGNWVRGLHRYSSDAAVVATLVHAVRMVAQGRSWGPRVLAWVSGVALLGLLFVCGVTGFVMVWDGFGAELALEGARIVDTLPILSEPISRAFVGERPIQGVFFFLNLFVHVGIPLAMALGLWLHVSRLARPVLLPPRALARGLVLLLLAVKQEMQAVMSGAFLIALTAAVWALLGTRLVRGPALFPLLYLWLMAPLPGPLLNDLTLNVQRLSTWGAAKLLALLFLHPVQDGNIIRMENYTLHVDVPCSGFKLLLTLLTFSSAFAYLTDAPLAKRWALFLLSLPLSVLVNSIRIMMIGVVGECIGSDAAHTFHDWSGMISLVLCAALLFGAAKALKCRTFAGQPIF